MQKSTSFPTAGSSEERKYRPGATLGDVLMTRTRRVPNSGRIASTTTIAPRRNKTRRARSPCVERRQPKNFTRDMPSSQCKMIPRVHRREVVSVLRPSRRQRAFLRDCVLGILTPQSDRAGDPRPRLVPPVRAGEQARESQLRDEYRGEYDPFFQAVTIRALQRCDVLGRAHIADARPRQTIGRAESNG